MTATAHSFTIDDIHRRQQGAVCVVGVQSTEGKVFPAAQSVAKVLGAASARELSRFLGQLANVDGRGFVVSFTATMNVEAARDTLSLASNPIDLESMVLRSDVGPSRNRANVESVSCDDLGLNIGART